MNQVVKEITAQIKSGKSMIGCKEEIYGTNLEPRDADFTGPGYPTAIATPIAIIGLAG